MIQTQTRPAFPQVGQVFELTASEEVTGLGLVADFGYNAADWKSTATSVSISTTRRFKLVQVGYEPNLAAVARACKAQGGKDTSGCWVKVFDDTFGHNDLNPVGVPDASWVGPYNFASFPMVGLDGYRGFERARGDWQDYWFWLVEVE